MHAEYVAEMVRQMMYAQYQEEAYTRGLNVVTTIDSADQDAAYQARAQGRDGLRTAPRLSRPGSFVDLPRRCDDREQAIDDALLEHPDNGEIIAAVVTAASPKQVQATFIDGNVATIQRRRPALRAVRARRARAAEPTHPAGLDHSRREGRQGQLADHAIAASGGRVGFADAAGRRDPRAGRRLRLQQEQVQPRDPGVASAGFELQAVHLFGVARKGARTGVRSSTTRRCFSALPRPAARPGSRRTTTAASTVR